MILPCYGIIPARYQSTRLPGKPLADICGKPMFWHVYQRARQCAALAGVWIATDDSRIQDAADELNVPCLMTSESHPSGTDRVAEAVRLLSLPEECIIVNIQGDEPLLEPSMLSDLLLAFQDSSVRVATLATWLEPDAGREASPNQVKVVMALNGDALYFSRLPIPYDRRGGGKRSLIGHIGVYAFLRSALHEFVALTPSPLEECEQLEQLRFLENNIPLRVQFTRHKLHGVDTPEDLEAVRAAMAASSQ